MRAWTAQRGASDAEGLGIYRSLSGHDSTVIITVYGRKYKQIKAVPRTFVLSWLAVSHRTKKRTTDTCLVWQSGKGGWGGKLSQELDWVERGSGLWPVTLLEHLWGTGRVSGSLWPSTLDRMPHTASQAKKDACLLPRAYWWHKCLIRFAAGHGQNTN